MSRAPFDPSLPPPVEWARSGNLVAYPEALAFMEARAAEIAAGTAAELVWLLEHPHLYTSGTSARPEDLLAHDGVPVYVAGRGGQFTYHGPGQRVAYVMLDLKRRAHGDVRAFVAGLESWLIAALAGLGLSAHVRPGRVGVWVDRPDKGPGREDKIAAIGIRVRRWVSFHGISLNASCDLARYRGIVPCGISDQGVTSLADLGQNPDMGRVDDALRTAFERQFGATRTVAAPLAK